MSEPVSRAQQYLKEAFQALLRGDKAERDRLCDLSSRVYDEEQRLLRLESFDPVSKN